MFRYLAPLAVVPFLAFAAGASNWPQFRGEGARGVSDATGLPEKWSATENVAWKTEIPGRGWSSPVVWDGRIFLTTVINFGETEAAKKGLYLGGERPDAPESVHQYFVYCLDLESGGVVWKKMMHEGKPATPRHLKNSYASATPVTDGERVYAYFGNLGIWCLDFDGNEVWNKPIEPREIRAAWGTGASPALHENRLYIVNDNNETSYMVALDKRTGDEVWRVPRDEKSNWSTPFVWRNELRTEIVTAGSKAVRSYDLEGRPLWSLSGMSSITIATPYATDGLLYVSSGYVGSRLKPVYAIRPGAKGDISLEDGQTANEWIAWSDSKGAPYNPSTLVYNGRLFVLYDMGFFACYDAADGTPIVKRERIPDVRPFTASPWAYQGKVFCLSEDGVTCVYNADDPVELLYTNKLAGDEMAMATPAIADGRLIIRTEGRVYCIGK